MDRRHGLGTLAQRTADEAIKLLDDKDADEGFFLQVESASIDKADHAADACGMIGETDQIDEVIKEALDFAKKDKDTLIVVTADHAHTAEIVPDGEPSVSPVTRLKSPKDGGAVMSVAFGTVPWETFESGNYSMQHTGTQVRIAGYGPGSENVNGQLDQTDAFYVMANALGLNNGTKGGQKQVDSITKARETRSIKTLEEAKSVKGNLENAKVTLKARAGENGRLFGAVTSKEIAEAVKARQASAMPA